MQRIMNAIKALSETGGFLGNLTFSFLLLR